MIGNGGPAGIQGAQGIQGIIGSIGATGFTGLQGDVGPSGGATGPVGPVGPAGTLGTLLSTNNSFSGTQTFNKIAMGDTIIQLRGNGDENHHLRFSAAVNGFQLMGFSGGLLGTPGTPNMIQLSNTGITTNSATTFTKPISIGTSGTSCSSMQFGSFTGVSNATQTVTYTNAFAAGVIPKVILTVVNSGQSFPTGNAFIVSESLTGFTYNFSFIQSNVFIHAENSVKINWMALQG